VTFGRPRDPSIKQRKEFHECSSTLALCAADRARDSACERVMADDKDNGQINYVKEAFHVQYNWSRSLEPRLSRLSR